MAREKYDRAVCHDCGVKEGEIHLWGCDMERCPFCGGQLISCDCDLKYFGYRIHKYPSKHPTCGLPKSIYKNGLSMDQEDEWMNAVEAKGRIPYILYPSLCAYCGEMWPNMFSVEDEEWNYYVAPEVRHKMLCRKCYNRIRKLINNYAD